MFWVLGEGPASCKASPLVVLDPVHGEIRARVPCHKKNAGMDCSEFEPAPPPRTPKIPPSGGWESAGWRPRLPLGVRAAIVAAALTLLFAAALWALGFR